MRLQKITLRYIPVTVTVEQVAEAIGEPVRRHVLLLDRIVSRKRPGIPQTSTFVIHFSNADAAEVFLNTFVPSKELDVPEGAVVVPAPWQRIVRVSPDPPDKKENTYTTDPVWVQFTTQSSRNSSQQPVESDVQTNNKAVDLCPLVAELVARQHTNKRPTRSNKKLVRRPKDGGPSSEKRKVKKRHHHRFHHREAEPRGDESPQVFLLKRSEENNDQSSSEQRYTRNFNRRGGRARNRRLPYGR